MTRVCHLFDGSAGWEQRVGVSQLRSRLPRDRYGNVLAGVDPVVVDRLEGLGRPIKLFHRLPRLTLMASPTLRRFLIREGIKLVHAWGFEAALAAHMGSTKALVLELFDPQPTKTQIKLVRTLARRAAFAVACSAETVRRRLIEGGVPPGACVVIRPGVDFALINRCRQGELRRKLGLAPDEFVVIVPEPATRVGRELDTYWAVEQIHHLTGNIRIIVPGNSREQKRIRRIDRTGFDSRVVICPGRRFPFEELVSISDALVAIPKGDVSTTSIAWAMAAGAAVIGTATYAAAELISNKVNGLLFKPRNGESPALAVARFLQDRSSMDRLKEVARGHAYEVFSARRFIDQHIRLYQNLLSGASPSEGIVDSAMVT